MFEYTAFEMEIRNPGQALTAAVAELRSMRENSAEELDKAVVIAIVDKAIADDIGMTRENVLEYFDCYSDMYKDYNGFRPRWDYTNEYYSEIYRELVVSGNDSTNYSDYTLFHIIAEYEEERRRKANENFIGTTLNGSAADAEEMASSYLDYIVGYDSEDYARYVEEETPYEYEEYTYHHKVRYGVKRRLAG